MKLMLAVAVGIVLDAAIHFRSLREQPREFASKWVLFVAGLLLYGGLFWATGELL